MATIIEQAPLSSSDYNRTPVGQNIMFAASNNIIVANQIKVKFIAEVHISSYLPPVPGTTTHLVGTFKTTPNNIGVGMFDFRPIIESYVKADNLAKIGSEYKLTPTTTSRTHPIHLIDKFSGNDNIMRYLFVNFKVEYLDQDAASSTYNELIQVEPAPSESYKIFNGYLKYTDKLDQIGVDFGYSTAPFVLANSSTSFLTNASTTQYANITDYGTVSMMNIPDFLKVVLTYYDSGGGSLGSDSVTRNATNGAPQSWSADIGFEVLHFGCYPGNLRNWSSTFQGIVSTISYYTVQVQTVLGGTLSDTYTINVNCPTLKGYEPVRLAWLNQWGAWDYFQDIVETTSALNQYVTPARLTTSSYTRKTVANDKLMQYTFEVEKSKTLRTQSA
jgi:hypothetical protein